jgi:transglutaminase-like putative cysteine protease
MARTVLVSLLPAVLIVSGWRRLEDPPLSREFLFAAALGIGAALVPRRGLRIAAVLAGLTVAGAVAFRLSPLDARPFSERDFVGPLLTKFGGGILDFYEVGLPFDPSDRARMHGVVVVAVFAFTVLAALAVAARRPILASAAMFAGAAWPVTLVPDRTSTGRGVLLLASALILLAALRSGARRPGGQALLAGAGVVVASLVAVSSPSIAKGGFLDWEQWQPYARDKKPVSVEYVWNADYDGIRFPKKPTTVLKIKAGRNVPYWRATTLDHFVRDHWVEDAEVILPTVDGDREELTADWSLPPGAGDPRNWTRQEVTVEALRDRHLVGASVPIAFEEGTAAAYGSGIAFVSRLRRGYDYNVWSYVRQPRPAQLTRSPARYPAQLTAGSPFLTVDRGVSVPPFGVPGRDAVVQDLLVVGGLSAYTPLYRQARNVVKGAPNPYAAVVALEAWFRTSNEFRYDEGPPASRGRPPLVAFVAGHRRGYCQHFAGAMALMLRYLGIPARVAAGFTSGTFGGGEWTVSDTNAHTWVEVWFDGYGWLPFDPTPGRGRLRASYTASSLFFDANGATAAFAGVAAAALGLDILKEQLDGSNPTEDEAREDDPATTVGAERASSRDSSGSGVLRALAIALLAGVVLVGILWAGKAARRRARYMTDDARLLAAAVRAELVEFLADQRFTVAASATPAELGAAVRKRFRVDTDVLVDALGAARFGPAAEADSSARRARRELRRVLRAVRRRRGARARLRGVLSLRSFRLVPLQVMLPRFWVASTKPEVALRRAKAGQPW